ncbi:Homeobox protein AKR [Escovopsis weberi]|uniref:Homeobox protein AKR n=1 Tax=Escovopsis weberi TaxID=150374 RepID=A0A0M8N2Z0_ESCWE|nr:Homeobox protein AKR [Escovopsis weberi]
MGMLGTGPDAKPRKRRGNLPKETTDKLRAWFAKNLRHPYPSEEQKQDLIRQTGLQMNQIANWFINARRRHLPAMLEAARKDDDAQNMGNPGSMGSSSVTPASLPPSLASSPRSECHGLGRRRMSPVKRGSV